MKNSDLPAMPFEGGNNNGIQPSTGLTKREMFAMEAMKAMISNNVIFIEGDMHSNDFHQAIKRSCYSIADTMLEEE